MQPGIGDIIRGLADPKVLSRHCLNYIHLYTKPLMMWRKMVSPFTDGVSILVTQLLYLLVVLILVLKVSSEIAIPYLVAEVLFTCVPFLWLLIPFLLFRQLFKKSVATGQMFRLLVVLKLQFIVAIGLLAFLLVKYKSETAYLILDNLIWTLILLFIVVLPLVLKLQWWKRIVWILGNYVFFLLAFVGIGFLITSLPDSNRINKALALPDPTIEYSQMIEHYAGAYNDVIPQVLFLLRPNSQGNGYYLQTQFVTSDLGTLFLDEFRKNQSIDSSSLKLREDILADRTTQALDSTAIAQRIDSIAALPEGYISILDSAHMC